MSITIEIDESVIDSISKMANGINPDAKRKFKIIVPPDDDSEVREDTGKQSKTRQDTQL